MSAERLLRSVRLHGASLAVENDVLVLYDGAHLPPTLKAALKRHKGELLTALSETGVLEPPEQKASPLAEKLREYGEPFPLTVNSRLSGWLVADDEAAALCEIDGPVYTAAEADRMANMSTEEVHRIHAAKVAAKSP